MTLRTTAPTDEQLVESFQRGDAEGFRILVRRYEKAVYGFAFRVSGSHADADDLSQEIFLRVYLNLGRFRREATFRTWMYRVARSRAANFRRKAVLDRFLRKSWGSEEARGPGSSRNPPVCLEEKSTLEAAVRKLPNRQRDTLILRFYQGLKFREIAEVMGCSEGTAKANLFHALRSLRARLRVEERNGRPVTLDLP